MSDGAPELPVASAVLARVVRPIDRFFDRLYSSRYNPFYRSGTLVVGLLIVLFATGLYLVCFYSLSDPYGSIERIDSQAWSGRWIRALHRYATGLTFIAILFHVLQLLAQGKTWGPRCLAWVSGVLLTGAMFVSAWSGYVMVWDEHGQLVAAAGAEIFRLLPFLGDTLARAFDGSTPVTAGFFFMNLFLHVALPVAILIGLWVHTCRLSRAVWFPIRTVFVGVLASLLVLSLLWPAPMLQRADLLRIVGRVPVDVFTGFWLWLWRFGSPLAVAGGWLAAALFLISIPWWWKPATSRRRGPSRVDESRCTGCRQCASDCPHEAIEMVPRPDGRRLMARVNPDLCVSCGICAASCDERAIGPEGRTAEDQLREATRFLQELPGPHADRIVVAACLANGSLPAALKRRAESDPRFAIWKVDCCGTVHSDVLEHFLDRVSGVVLIGCPGRNCRNRDGLSLLSQRIFEKRVPFLRRDIDRSRLLVVAASEAEAPQTIRQMVSFADGLGSSPADEGQRRHRMVLVRAPSALFFTAALLVATGSGSRVQFGEAPDFALLRISARMPNEMRERCRAPGTEELERLPAHMRVPVICDATALRYRLVVKVDGDTLIDRTIGGERSRADLPLFVQDEIVLRPGSRLVDASLRPENAPDASKLERSYRGKLEAEAGRAYLLTGDSSAGSELQIRGTLPIVPRMEASPFT